MNDVIKSINVDGVEYDIQAKELTKVTYAELKELRDNSGLVAGHLYRITDYEFTTKQVDTKGAGHVFDIIVLAVAENELSHIARAIAHEGDTYFDGNDLGAWELWYELDNDAEKYAWADAENGKGIIYRMIDEKRNDCPYDFKNALFYQPKLIYPTTSDNYYYTFSYVVSGVLYDGTVEKQVTTCYGNSMGVTWTLLGKKEVNKNMFQNSEFSSKCHSNTFGHGCHSNIFKDNCYSNTFGYDCYSNTFGSSFYFSTFGDKCYSNTLGTGCERTTFGDECHNNNFESYCKNTTFGNACVFNTFAGFCVFNTFADLCSNNTLEKNCTFNTFGSDCQYNKFEHDCNHNYFGHYCNYNYFGYDSCSNTFGNDVSHRKLYLNNTSINLNDEYFDDGSGQLVPIKHPDLSTQPSILPYKIMGQYVYEQLICLGTSTNTKHTYNFPKGFLTDIAQPLGIKNPIVIRVEGFAYGRGELWDISGNYTPAPYIHGIPVTVDMKTYQLSEGEVKVLRTSFTATRPSIENFGSEDVALTYYARIVFTSMPDEGGYYGYNNY